MSAKIMFPSRSENLQLISSAFFSTLHYTILVIAFFQIYKIRIRSVSERTQELYITLLGQ